jgi:tetratricopeptide (TPR) repeat protein
MKIYKTLSLSCRVNCKTEVLALQQRSPLDLSQLTPWLLFIFVLLAPFFATPAKAAEEGKDWNTLDAFRKKLGSMRTKEPQGAVDAYLAFFKKNTNFHPLVASVAIAELGDTYYSGLKDSAKALETYSQGIEANKDDLSVVILIEGKSKILLSEKKAEEAAKLVSSFLPQLKQAGQSLHPYLIMMGASAMRQYITALEQQGENKEVIAHLQEVLVEDPIYLSDTRQGIGGWMSGWMFEKLVDKLIYAEKPEEALSWAKLYFMTCDFEKGAIERATRTVARAWTAMDEFSAVKQFSLAQKDPTQPNPLIPIKLPAGFAGSLLTRLPKLQNSQGRPAVVDDKGRPVTEETTDELLMLRIAQGTPEGLRQAMEQARQALRDNPDSSSAMKQVAIVFKAADLNLSNANAFLDYMNGKGKNPMPDFLKKYAASDELTSRK